MRIPTALPGRSRSVLPAGCLDRGISEEKDPLSLDAQKTHSITGTQTQGSCLPAHLLPSVHSDLNRKQLKTRNPPVRHNLLS